MLNHRGPEFGEITAEAADLAQPVIGTRNKVLFFASSGTGVMEAALANALGEGDKVLILSNGQFGERFVSIAKALNLDADVLEAPWEQAVPIASVKEKTRRGRLPGGCRGPQRELDRCRYRP